MSDCKARIALVGVGNVLMGDEGVGVRVVEEMRRRGVPKRVELFDAGTAFHSLIGELEGFDKLVIVDAIKGGKPPGTIYRFELEEIEGKTGVGDMFSLHDMGVIEALFLERLTGHRIPDKVVIIGIEPERIELTMELSPTLKGRLLDLIQLVSNELNDIEEEEG